MRTVKQLAAVTGIDYETVRYYCTPLPKKNEKGENVGRRGAGLVSPVSRKGRWNQYDDKALFDLLLIGLFRKANFHIREIRDVLQGVRRTGIRPSSSRRRDSSGRRGKSNAGFAFQGR